MAKTIFIDSIRMHREEIEQAAMVLRNGGLVAFPTETVFGLGAHLFNQDAVERIFAVKNRPQGLPLAIHLAATKYIRRWVKHFPPEAEPLIEEFLPGPLMLVLEKAIDVPDYITGGSRKIGIRVPHHPVAGALLGLTAVPVVATSANLSGYPTAVTVQQVQEQLGDKIDLILDAREAPLGIESTVLDLTTSPPRILRSGFVSAEAISRVLGETVMLSPEPAMYKNGAEKLNFSEVWLFSGEQQEIKEQMQESCRLFPQRDKTFLLTTEMMPAFREQDRVYCLGSRDNLEEIAGNLFNLLNLLKEETGDLLLIEGLPETGLGAAIMERLKKFATRICRAEKTNEDTPANNSSLHG